MVFGSTEIEAVGDGGGGGGGGGAGAAFFLQAPSIITTLNASTRVNHLIVGCFTLFLLQDPKMIAFRGSDEVYLFPTPVGLAVAPGESQLPDLGAIGQHHADLFGAGAARLR